MLHIGFAQPTTCVLTRNLNPTNLDGYCLLITTLATNPLQYTENDIFNVAH